ncbi:MAG: hypothetical protein LBJ42_00620 [Holosporales bacterium]|jgi:hypothetical protein|nr:hypothetical protein [Holosporales bacterium]
MFGGVKITLITSLTILTSCVLLIAYNECAHRYAMHGNRDNTIWIFDKKSATLNKCGEDGCKVVETKFPRDSPLAITQSFAPSRMFGSDKPMHEAAKAAVEATNADTGKSSGANGETMLQDSKKTAETTNETKDASPDKSSSSDSADKSSTAAVNTDKKQEEFVE